MRMSLRNDLTVGVCGSILEGMNLKINLLCFVLIATGCASGPLAGGRAKKNVCIISTTEDRAVDVVDGAKQKARGSYGDRSPKRVEVAPGRHTYTFGSTGNRELFKLAFECKAGHHYILRKRAAGADLYGTRWVWMIEDARTKEVVVAQSP